MNDKIINRGYGFWAEIAKHFAYRSLLNVNIIQKIQPQPYPLGGWYIELPSHLEPRTFPTGACAPTSRSPTPCRLSYGTGFGMLPFLTKCCNLSPMPYFRINGTQITALFWRFYSQFVKYTVAYSPKGSKKASNQLIAVALINIRSNLRQMVLPLFFLLLFRMNRRGREN